MKRLILCWVLYFVGVHGILWAQCTPVSAQILSSGDDTTTFWINDGAVPGVSSYCQPPCVPSPITVPITDFNDGQNFVLSIATTNVNPTLAFSSWSLDITCQGGGHSVVTSENPSTYSLYWNPNGGCARAIPPGNDSSSNDWTSYNYAPSPNPFTLGAGVR